MFGDSIANLFTLEDGPMAETTPIGSREGGPAPQFSIDEYGRLRLKDRKLAQELGTLLAVAGGTVYLDPSPDPEPPPNLVCVL